LSSLGHLERHRLRIKTLSPIYIGSGLKLNKKEYIYMPNGQRIIFVHFDKLITFLDRKKLLHLFEKFMIDQDENNGLYDWLQRQKINEEQYREFSNYSIKAGNALGIGIPFREIHTFVKNSHGEPYLPGSSVKGAIRTAIAANFLMDQRPRFSRNLHEIETQAKVQRKGKYYLKTQAESLENTLFRKLNLVNNRKNAVNDILRGIQISDSLPINSEKLILCLKIDRRKDGTSNINNRNQATGLLFRECIQPQTEIEASLTLDHSVLKGTGISVDFIKEALDEFEENYYESFASQFTGKPEDAEYKCREGFPLIIGGGVGFASKTLIYPLADQRERGVKIVSQILSKQFPANHKHTQDVSLGVSPHIIKFTKVNNKNYPMGYCEVCIDK
jgi:CRISPR-associated protein Csm5